MTDTRVAALAAALHDEWDRRQGEPSEPGVLCPACVDSAAAILAALPADWCGHDPGLLAPDLPGMVREHYCPEIARLRTDRDALSTLLDYEQATIARLRAIEEPAREVADYLTADPLQTVVPDGRVRALRAAIAQAKEASDG